MPELNSCKNPSDRNSGDKALLDKRLVKRCAYTCMNSDG